MQKPRILVTASTFPRHQNDTDPPFIQHLCSGLQQFEIHVLAPHTKGSQIREIMNGVHVHRYRYGPEAWENLAYDGGMLRKVKNNPMLIFLLPTFFVCQWLEIRRLHRQYQFSLLHAHWIIPQGIVALFSPLEYIITSHGGDLFALDNIFFRPIKKLVLNKARAITVVSHAMATQCVKLGVRENDIHIMPMGIDGTTRFTPPKNSDNKRKGILFVGRLVEKKGVIHLIHAISILARQQRQFLLTIIGDGPDKSQLEAEVKKHSLEGQVIFKGALRQSEIIPYYQQAKLFVLPSIISRDGDQEGLGLVTLEAMACGCPVIASDLPAVRDVVNDRQSGLLVPPANPDALAGAVLELMDNSALREELSRVGINKSKEFDWTTVCANYGKLMARLLNNHI